MKTVNMTTIAVLSTVLCAAAAHAQSPYVAPISMNSVSQAQEAAAAPSQSLANLYSATAQAQSNGRVIVPERTEVHVRLLRQLKSGESKVGDEVPLQVVDDVYAEGHVLAIPAGTPAFGTVTDSHGHGMFNRAGKLNFSIDYVFAPDHTHVPLKSASNVHSGKGEGGAMIALTYLAGPVGLLVSGRDCTIPEGAEFVVTVAQDTPVLPTPVAGGSTGGILNAAYGAPAASYGAAPQQQYVSNIQPVPQQQYVSNAQPAPQQQLPQQQYVSNTQNAPGTVQYVSATQSVPAAAQGMQDGAQETQDATPALTSASLFTSRNGQQAVGQLIGYDGRFYSVRLIGGDVVKIAAKSIKSIQSLSSK